MIWFERYKFVKDFLRTCLVNMNTPISASGSETKLKTNYLRLHRTVFLHLFHFFKSSESCSQGHL